MVLDRLKAAFLALARGADSFLDYRALYRARVTGQTGSTVDVAPVDERLPVMSKIPLRTGAPGLSFEVKAGAYVLIGFDNGRPDGAFACLFDYGDRAGSTNARACATMSAVADVVELGDAGATQALIKGTAMLADLATLHTAIDVFAAACGTALPALVTPAATLKTAIGVFAGKNASHHLSTRVKTA